MSEEFRAVRPDELEKCLDLWGNVFERVGRAYFVPYFHGDPWFDRDYTRVCVVDGRIVSAVQVCKRRVQVGSAELIMGGIGNVATDPEFRGKGYSSHLMRDTIRVMRQHDMDFSVLFTGIQPFYERLGWRSVPQKTLMGHIKSAVSSRKQPRYHIRPTDRDKDQRAIQRIYDVWNKGRPLTTVRTPEYWEGYLSMRHGKPELTLVAEADGDIVGYLWYGHDQPNCWLKEIAWLPGHEACVSELIAESVERAYDAGLSSLIVHLPAEPEILSAVGEVAERIEPREPMGMMCRLINPDSLVRRMLPELTRRAQQAGLSSVALSLTTELGRLDFSIENGRAVAGGRDAKEVSLTQTEFFCLLFGIKSVKELGLSLSGRARHAISALFPPQRPVFWLADHF